MSKNKQEAGKRAHELMGIPFVILDLETTGWSGKRDEIVSIAIIDHTGAVLLDTLIKPVQPIFNSDIHGITDEMVANAPSFAQVYPAIVEALQNKTVLAYNSRFDGSFIDGNCLRHGLDRPRGMKEICVMLLYAKFYGQWNTHRRSYRWHKLNKAADHLGLTFSGNQHGALADAQMTLAILQKMAEWYAMEGLKNG